jgi:peptidoglycan/LPS O-acetylase OafA/YrhL
MRKRLPELDGIRGIAIIVVMLHNESGHYPVSFLPRLFTDGWMGVDLFFVLSGFLITQGLLATRTSEHYFKSFYSKRCLRIWPLYYAMLLVMFAAVPLLSASTGEQILERASPRWSYPFFLQNLFVSRPSSAVGLLGVSWSLAIEEQFYLVWPWIVRFCSKIRLRWVAVAVLGLSPLIRLVLASHHVDLYSNTFSRLDGVMAGSLLAICAESFEAEMRRFTPYAWTVLLAGGALAVLTQALHLSWIVFSFSAVASAALVYLALYSGHSWLRRILSNRFLVYTGTISYGLYLMHKIPFDIAISAGFDRYPVVELPLLLALSYAVAGLSWRFWESPWLRLKRVFEPARTAVENVEPLNEAVQPVP